MKSFPTITLLIAPLIIVSGQVGHVQAESGPSLADDAYRVAAVNDDSGTKKETATPGEPEPGAGAGAGAGEKGERPRRPLLREMQERRGAERLEGEREGREGRGPRELSQEQIKAALEILKEQNPELARRMSEALEQRPEMAQRLIANHWPRLERLIELKKNNPRLFRLTMDEFRLQRQMFENARKLRHTNEAVQKDELRKQLSEQAGRLFDLRMKIKEAEVDALEKRLTEMREQLKQTHGEREDRIAEQLKDLEEGKPPMPPPAHREPAKVEP